MALDKNQDKYETLREDFYEKMKDFLALQKSNAADEDLETCLIDLHHSAILFFRQSSKVLTNATTTEIDEAPELTQSLADSALHDANTIIKFWIKYREICKNRGFQFTPPSDGAYRSFQRVIKKYFPERIKEMKEKFESAQIPVDGFGKNEKHSMWKKPSNKSMLIILVITGALFIGCFFALPYINSVGNITEAGKFGLNVGYSLLGLFLTIVLFGYLGSTGMVKTKGYVFYGAAAFMIVFLNFFIWRVNNDEFEIKGQVLYSGKPSEGVEVSIPQIEKHDLTNEYGNFKLSIFKSQLEDVLRVRVQKNKTDTTIEFTGEDIQQKILINL